MDEHDLSNRFTFHAATTEEKRDAHTSIRQACRELAFRLNDKMPEGREKSLAITKLEECMFWGNAGLARMQSVPEPTAPSGFHHGTTLRKDTP